MKTPFFSYKVKSSVPKSRMPGWRLDGMVGWAFFSYSYHSLVSLGHNDIRDKSKDRGGHFYIKINIFPCTNDQRGNSIAGPTLESVKCI